MIDHIKVIKKLNDHYRDYMAMVTKEGIPRSKKHYELYHMAFWHSYYDRVAGSLVKGEVPVLETGTYASIDQKAKEEFGSRPFAELLRIISKAHKSLVCNVMKLDEHQYIPYKKDARGYNRDAFICVVARHYKLHSDHISRLLKIKH